MEDVDPAYYRFDNIHFKRAGDDLVFQIIKNLTLPGVPLDINKFLPAREAFIGSGGQAISQKNNSEQILVQMTATTPTVTGANYQSFADVVNASYASRDGYVLCDVELPYGYDMGSITPLYNNPSDLSDAIKLRRIGAPRTAELFRDTSTGGAAVDGSNNYVYITAVRQAGVIV